MRKTAHFLEQDARKQEEHIRLVSWLKCCEIFGKML